MGQVPVYLFIGNGRLSRHLQFYFQKLHLHHRVWTRNQPLDTKDVTHVLLAINDDSIVPFILEHPEIAHLKKFHFSGSLSTELAWGAHPLMTFTQDLYPEEVYREIHFVLDQDAPEFLPGLPNPHHRLATDLKARYHAECVLSGNFTALLWSHFFQVMEKQLGLPREAALPYLKQVTSNLQGQNPLTGPLVRKDQQTIDRNLKALEGDPYQNVYTSFVEAYQKS